MHRLLLIRLELSLDECCVDLEYLNPECLPLSVNSVLVCSKQGLLVNLTAEDLIEVS